LALDFSHAISSSNCEHASQLDFIKEFIKFKPMLCHLSLTPLPLITLETIYSSPMDYHKKDIEILRKLFS
jgi:hypothetical protein